MSFTIEESSHPWIWKVIHSGRVDLEARLLALEVGKGILAARDVEGVLVDFRGAELVTSEEQAYELSKARVSGSTLLGVKTALLFDRIPDEVDFDTVVARNRGLDFRAFSDEEEAYGWLLDES